LPDQKATDAVLKAVTEQANAVDEHAVALESGKPMLGDPLDAKSAIVKMTQQMFRTLLGEELGLRAAAFDQSEKEEALELQADRDIPDYDEGGLDQLVELFCELCDRWPEVLDLRYGGTRADFREFRTVFVPALLEGLTQWSYEKGDAALSERLDAVDRHYTAAVRHAARAPAEIDAREEDEE
jgi:hypothetical protein